MSIALIKGILRPSSPVNTAKTPCGRPIGSPSAALTSYPSNVPRLVPISLIQQVSLPLVYSAVLGRVGSGQGEITLLSLTRSLGFDTSALRISLNALTSAGIFSSSSPEAPLIKPSDIKRRCIFCPVSRLSAAIRLIPTWCAIYDLTTANFAPPHLDSVRSAASQRPYLPPRPIFSSLLRFAMAAFGAADRTRNDEYGDTTYSLSSPRLNPSR